MKILSRSCFVRKSGGKPPHSTCRGPAEMGSSSARALHGAAGGGCGGPGPLEVEAAEVAGDVNDFADEEETGNFAGLHGFAGEFVGVYAADGDFGLLKAFSSCGCEGPSLYVLFESGQRGIRPGAGRVVVQPCFCQAFGEELLEGFFCGGQIARACFADGGGGIAVGSEIDADGFAFVPIAGDLEDGGAA